MNKKVKILKEIIKDDFYNYEYVAERYSIESIIVFLDIENINISEEMKESICSTMRPFDKIFFTDNILCFFFFHCNLEQGYSSIQKKIAKIHFLEQEPDFSMHQIKNVTEINKLDRLIRNLLKGLKYPEDTIVL